MVYFNTGIDPFLTMYKVQRQLSSADVLTLVTVPIVLVPAISGYVFVPRYGFFQKPAGTAYGITSFTGPGIYSNGSLLLGGNIAAGLLDQAAAENIVMYGVGNAASLFSGTNVGSTGSGDLVIKGTGSNPTTGTSPLNVEVFYNLFPITWSAA